MSTKFFTNTNERSLFDKFKGIIHSMHNMYAFHAVVGYFRSSGYFALQPYLKDIPRIKILVGINVDQMFASAQRKGLLYFGDENKTKKEFLDWFIQDIKEAKYDEEVEQGIIQFANDLIEGKIEVRAHNSKTLHAKFYLFLPQNHNEDSDGCVIMGSSNLTEAGLGIKKSPNYELNVSMKDYDDVSFAKNEFETLWKESTPILSADIQQFKQKTHIGQEFSPYELYIKFLIEYFGKNIDYDPDTVGDLPKSYKKLAYQVDAVNQGYQMLIEHNGFFLSDVVGLGKTIVAAMIAKRFLIANGSLNTKILVVYPPALEKNWKSTFRTFGIDKHAKFITNGRLEKILDESDMNYWAKEEYDLILVDEAHRYRNHTSQMFNALQRLCKAPRAGEGLVPGTKKKVMLISATPLNNRPQDLYYQLLLFQDSRRSTLPETNLQKFFGPIIREYKEILKSDKPDIERIRQLYSQIREKVISPITVRRTRKDLDKYPKYKNDLLEQGIKFPEMAAPKAKIYKMDAELSKLFGHTISDLTEKDKINFYRYQAISYLKDDLQEQYGYERAELVSKSLAGIIKTLMIKRLESSFHAFKISLQNLATSTERMIQMFDAGKILIAPDMDVNEMMNKGMSIDEIEEAITVYSIDNPRNNTFAPQDFDDELLNGLRKDLRLLNELITEWDKIEQDPKLNEFIYAIENELLSKAINPTGKLVIFTESTDTADYLQQKLEKELSQKILCVSSTNRSKIFETIQENFDANYDKQKNNYNIIITTDVLAEGINLHRANVIVNYDTPWNATRLMQRVGRVNRIGSVADVIYNYNFYPSQEGNEEIQLYNNALIKLQAFHSAFGEDSQIYTHEELVEQFELFKEGMPDEEDKRIRYLMMIRDFKDKNPYEFKRIKELPMKARTARNVGESDKNEINGSSIVFLKSPYKIEFYAVDRDKQAKPLTFLEAAGIFEAKPAEPGYKLPDYHFEQVKAALMTFEQDFLSSSSETVTTTDKADATTQQANKFLRDYKKITHRDNIKAICETLSGAILQGIYTSLPNEVNKINKQLTKKTLTLAQADNLMIKISAKYDITDTNDDTNEKIDTDLNPDIIISETFLQ